MQYLGYEKLVAMHIQGDKRTARRSLRRFLRRNRIAKVIASKRAIIEMCYAAETEKWSVDQIGAWLRTNSAAPFAY